jgi:hypothetical protein
MEQKYTDVVNAVRALISDEKEEMSVLANVAAELHDSMGYFWVGFYLVRGGELRLGPFQGPVACYRIRYGRGVCGTAWEQAKTLIVPDVEAFPGHIACSSLSRSEIVVPLRNAKGEVVGVLDIDSKELNAFTPAEGEMLEEVCAAITEMLYSE